MDVQSWHSLSCSSWHLGWYKALLKMGSGHSITWIWSTNNTRPIISGWKGNSWHFASYSTMAQRTSSGPSLFFQFQPNRWSNLFSLSPKNKNQMAPCPPRTLELKLGSSHDHKHTSQVSQPSIQTHKLDSHSHTQPQRIRIQPMEGTQLPYPWSGPKGISSNPQEMRSAADNHSIPQ